MVFYEGTQDVCLMDNPEEADESEGLHHYKRKVTMRPCDAI